MRKIYTLLVLLLVSICMSAQQINGDLNKNKKLDIEDVTMLIDDYLNETPHYISASLANPYAVDNSRIMGTWYVADKSSLVLGEDGYVTMNGTRYQYKFVPAHGRLLMFNEGGKFAYCNRVYILEDDFMLMESKSGSVEYTRTMPVVNVSSITLSSTALTIVADDSRILTATILPAYADNVNLVWTSSNEGVATVNNGTVVAIKEGTAVITASAADGSGVKAECVVTVNGRTYKEGHEYVDLGLPSGTLWATCNVGASSPEEYGDYFAWGETTPKSEYSWSTYKHLASGYSDEQGCSKYQIADEQKDGVWYSDDTFVGDNKTVLDPEDDAAHVNWGGDWRMPTRDEMGELRSECTWSWTSVNGVYGRKVVGPNGNSIFLPVAGYRYDSTLDDAGSFGFYLTSTLYISSSSRAYCVGFDSSDVASYSDDRSDGLSVRPVCK